MSNPTLLEAADAVVAIAVDMCDWVEAHPASDPMVKSLGVAITAYQLAAGPYRDGPFSGGVCARCGDDRTLTIDSETACARCGYPTGWPVDEGGALQWPDLRSNPPPPDKPFATNALTEADDELARVRAENLHLRAVLLAIRSLSAKEQG